MRYSQAFVFAVALVASLSVARADFVITIGNPVSATTDNAVPYSVGSTVNLGLYIHNDLSATNLSGQNFGLAFDISAPGAPDRYDGNSPLFQTAFRDFEITLDSAFAGGNASVAGPTDVASSTDPQFGFDALIDIDLGSPINFSANRTQATATKIGIVSFMIFENIANGTYGFKFAPDALFSDDFTPANSGPGGLTFAAGADEAFYNQFAVTAVPEPSSAIFFVIGASAIFLRRRRCKLAGTKTSSYV